MESTATLRTADAAGGRLGKEIPLETACREPSLAQSASSRAQADIGLGATLDSVADHQETINRVAKLLAVSRSILFVTGAGISADSGLPTYRGNGLPYNIDCTEDGLCVERALSGDLFDDHPELTWKYLSQIERMCRGVRHNRAHEVIAEMERHFERVWTLTQNMDGLHRAAGARNVIDVHGDLHNLRCTRCRHRETVADYSLLAIPPGCPECSSLLRPDIVLFGETLSPEKLMMMLIELDSGFDMVFSIGTSSVFPYVAEPIQMAADAGPADGRDQPGPHGGQRHRRYPSAHAGGPRPRRDLAGLSADHGSSACDGRGAGRVLWVLFVPLVLSDHRTDRTYGTNRTRPIRPALSHLRAAAGRL